MTDYINDTKRFHNLGINVRNDPDKVDQGQYRILNNAYSASEGSFTTRPGRVEVISTGLSDDVHTIKRIGTSFLLVGAGMEVFRNGTAYPTTGYSGNPLSVVVVPSTISSTVWAYVADSQQFRKLKEDGSDFKWGITGPSVGTIATAFGSGNLDSSVPGAIVYDWRQVYKSSTTGAKSNPSPVMDGIAAVGKEASIGVVASTDPQVDQILLYRRGGTQTDRWTLSVVGTNTTGFLIDDNSDEDIVLAEELEEDNFVPFTSVDAAGNTLYEVPLPYVWGPFLGKYILATGDPGRPGHVYWTNAERPDSSDVANNTPVSPPNEPLLGGFIYSSTPFVFSSENLYYLDFGGPLAVPKFVPRKTPTGKGLSAPWAFCTGPLVWFLSKDGIYQTDCQSPGVSITEELISPIFKGLDIEDLEAVDYNQQSTLRLFYADLKIHFLYTSTSGNRFHLTYHTLYKRWQRESVAPFNEASIYQDEKVPGTTVYVGGANGNVYTIGGTDDDGSTIAVRVRTGSYDFGQAQTKKELGNVIFDVDPRGGSITVVPYLNAETSVLATQVLTGTGRQKIPLSLADTYLYSLAFDLTWTGYKNLYQMEFLWRTDEEEIKHWEYPETTHQLSGWQHVRDIYISLRANAPVTLTLTIDGVAYTYPDLFPATSTRTKMHAYLRPVKGKAFRYALDSSASFRLYGEDCEVRVKSWNTNLGYNLVSPFVQAAGGS